MNDHMMVKALSNYVIIKPVTKTKTTVGGLEIPEAAKQTPQIGKVISVGTSTPREGMMGDILEGDEVFYKRWTGYEIEVNGEKWLALEYKDIIAVINYAQV